MKAEFVYADIPGGEMRQGYVKKQGGASCGLWYECGYCEIRREVRERRAEISYRSENAGTVLQDKDSGNIYNFRGGSLTPEMYFV